MAAFPGVHPAASPATNADVATFNAISNFTNISINSATPNPDSLNLATIAFGGASLSNFTVGSTTGNSLVMTSNAAQATSTNQIGLGVVARSGALTVTETINSPIVLAAQSSGAGANYSFDNNSTINSNADALIFNGTISAGTQTSAANASYGASLTLLGSNTNVSNAVNGVISNGGATSFGGLGVFKNGSGTWKITGANTYTGPTTLTGGILNITGTNNGGGVYNSQGGTIVFNSSGTIAASNLSLTASGGQFTLSGGTLSANSLIAIATSNGRFFNLNGGTFLVGTSVYSTTLGDIFNFNGGTLKSNNAAGISFDATIATTNTSHQASVQAGGGTLDTTIGNINSTAQFSGAAGGALTLEGGNTFKSLVNNNGLFTVQDNSIWDIGSTGGSNTPVFISSSVGGLSGNGSVVNSGSTAGTVTVNFANGPFTYSGSIAPAPSGNTSAANIGLIKSGTGTQILSGTNTYTGVTTINAGTLNVSATGSLGNTAVAVNGTGSLIVAGSVAGAVTVNGAATGTGGILAGTGSVGSVSFTTGTLVPTVMPGTTLANGSIGTLTVGTYNGANGTENLDLVTAGASDTISATNATFDSTNTFNLFGTPQAGTYTLFSSTNAINYISNPIVITPTGTRETFVPNYGPNAITLAVTGNSANLIWTGATNTTWSTSATDLNWNNTTSSINPDQFFNLDTVTFDNSSSNGNVTLNTTVQPTSVTVSNDASHPYTISGTGNITGSGTTLTKAGVGTLVLATTNTYTGATTVSDGGTLQIGNGGTTGSLGTGTVTMSGGSSLVFNRSDPNTLSTAVNGAGSLTQMGAGLLTITSSNNYSGSTIINSGTTLQIGNGGATGNLGATSDVQDNGTLNFSRNNTTGVINAPITGTGSLHMILGTLSLGANNSYGATTIDTGATLQVGTGGTTGSLGTGILTDNGTLAFNRSDPITAPVLGGTGGLAQNGTGTLSLGAGNTYSGTTTVSAGILAGTSPHAFGNSAAVNISNAAGTVSFRSDTSATFSTATSNTPYNVTISGATGPGGTINVDQATPAGTAAKTITIGNIDLSPATANTTLTLTGGNGTGLTAGNLIGPTLTSGTATVTINNNNTSGTTTIAGYQQSATTATTDALVFQGNGTTVITGGINASNDASVRYITGNITIKGSSSYSLGTIIGYNNDTPVLADVTVAIGNDNAFGTGTLNITAPAPQVTTFMSADANTRTILNPITNSAATANYGTPTTGNLIFGNPGTTTQWDKGQFPKNLAVNCAVMTINDVINNNPTSINGALSKSGPGTLVLTNANFYNSATILNAGTLLIANGTNGSATGDGSGSGPGTDSNVHLNGGVLASDNSTPAPDGTTPGAGGGTIGNNVVAGTGAHTIAPGGIGSIGFFNINGLTTSNLTTLNFDAGPGPATNIGGNQVVTNGDLLTLGGGTVSIGANTAITVGGSTVSGNDYRLIGGSIGGISLASFTLPAAPSGQSYSLSTSVDPGFIDLVVASGPAFLTWNNTGGTGDGSHWDTTNQNWNDGTNPALYTDGADVIFNDTNNAHYAVTLNTTVAPHSTTVSNNSGTYTIAGTGNISGTGGLTKSGTGALTISTVNTYSGNTNVTGGVMTIAAGGSIASNVVNVASGATLNVNGSLSATAAVTANGPVNFGGTTSNTPLTRTIASLTVAPAVTVSITPSTNALTPVTLQTGSLSITGTGKVDVGNNALIAPGSAASALTMIQGGQVVSSSIADSNHALGYITTGGTNFEIRYTLKGDANLSGNVDVGDLGALATSYGITGGMSWANGDFNQDGTVNVADLGALATNYGTNLGTSPSLGGGGLSAAEPLAQAASSGGSAAVPEPTSLGLLSVAAVGLMGRRRRRSASK